MGHPDVEQRRPHADRPRPRRRRQLDPLVGRHGQRCQRELLPERGAGDRVRPADGDEVPPGRAPARLRAGRADPRPAAAVHRGRRDAVPPDLEHRLGRRPAGHLRLRVRPELRDEPLLLRLLHRSARRTATGCRASPPTLPAPAPSPAASSSSTRTRRAPTPSTTAGRSTSATTASCTSPPASTSTRASPRTSPTPAARSTGSTSTAPSRRTTRSTTAPDRTGTASGPAVCATRTGHSSTRRPTACSSATSAATTTRRPRRRSTSAPAAPTTAGPTPRAPAARPCTSPIYFWDHNGRDAAVTGGFVYHGTQFPASYQGSYFFADYTQNWIRRLTFDASGNVTGVSNFEPADGSVDGPYGDIVYLVEGPDGALYYLDLGYSDISGQFGISKVRRIRYVTSNQSPIATAAANPTSGPTPLSVAFSSAGSADPEGQPLTLRVDVRRRWHVDRSQPDPRLRPAGAVHGAPGGLRRRQHDERAADHRQRRRPADGDDQRPDRRRRRSWPATSSRSPATPPTPTTAPSRRARSPGTSTSCTRATSTRARRSPASRTGRSRSRRAVTTSAATRATGSRSRCATPTG